MSVSSATAATDAGNPAVRAAGLIEPDLSPAWTEFLGMLKPATRLLVLGPEALAERLRTPERVAQVTGHPQAAPLPFADGSFDAAAGEQALEQSLPTESLAALWRVLKPDADAQFLVQHVHAPLQHAARWAQLECDVVLKKIHFFRRVHQLVSLKSATVTAATDRAANELRAGLKAMKQALSDVQAQGGGRVLTWAVEASQQLLRARNQLSPATAAVEVDRAESLLRGVWRRAGELVALGRSTEQMQALSRYAAGCGFTRIDCLLLSQPDGAPVAWQLLLHRP